MWVSLGSDEDELVTPLSKMIGFLSTPLIHPDHQSEVSIEVRLGLLQLGLGSLRVKVSKSDFLVWSSRGAYLPAWIHTPDLYHTPRRAYKASIPLKKPRGWGLFQILWLNCNVD